MLWLYLHFPNLQLDHYCASLQQTPPLALVDGYPPAVHSVNRQAEAMGIGTGQSIHTARCLAPELQTRYFDPGLQSRILHQLAEWTYQRASPITLWADDGLLLEASGLRRLHGSINRLWMNLEHGLSEQGFQVQLGLGITPRMARVLSRANRGLCSENTEALKRQLADLPLTQTALPVPVCERLLRMGLKNLAMLEALPSPELARRLGPEAIDHLQRLHGRKPDPQPPWTPPPVLVRRSDFILEVEHAQGLGFPLKRMLQSLADDLMWRQQATDRLQLSLHHRHQAPEHLYICSAAPEHRAGEFLQLCQLHLERHRLKAPVVALELRVARFIQQQCRDQDLFGTTGNTEEAFGTLRSRLQARLGESAIHFLHPRDDHRPEKGQYREHDRPTRVRPSSIVAPSRPFWLMQPPHPLQQAPRQWLDGPERIDAGWWDGEPVKRDYYAVRMADHRVAWIFRDNTGAWYLHGWFT